jgi:hypothetical protein
LSNFVWASENFVNYRDIRIWTVRPSFLLAFGLSDYQFTDWQIRKNNWAAISFQIQNSNYQYISCIYVWYKVHIIKNDRLPSSLFMFLFIFMFMFTLTFMFMRYQCPCQCRVRVRIQVHVHVDILVRVHIHEHVYIHVHAVLLSRSRSESCKAETFGRSRSWSRHFM